MGCRAHLHPNKHMQATQINTLLLLWVLSLALQHVPLNLLFSAKFSQVCFLFCCIHNHPPQCLSDHFSFISLLHSRGSGEAGDSILTIVLPISGAPLFFSPQVYPMSTKSGSQPLDSSAAKTFRVQNPGRNILVLSGSPPLPQMPPTARNEPLLAPGTDFLLPLEGSSRPPLLPCSILASCFPFAKLQRAGMKKVTGWDIPGDPVVKTPGFHSRGCRFDPWSGN